MKFKILKTKRTEADTLLSRGINGGEKRQKEIKLSKEFSTPTAAILRDSLE